MCSSVFSLPLVMLWFAAAVAGRLFLLDKVRNVSWKMGTAYSIHGDGGGWKGKRCVMVHVHIRNVQQLLEVRYPYTVQAQMPKLRRLAPTVMVWSGRPAGERLESSD